MAMPGLASLVTQRNHNLTSTTVIKSSQTRTCATMLALTSHYLATNAKHPRYAPRPPALPYDARSPGSEPALGAGPGAAPGAGPGAAPAAPRHRVSLLPLWRPSRSWSAPAPNGACPGPPACPATASRMPHESRAPRPGTRIRPPARASNHADVTSTLPGPPRCHIGVAHFRSERHAAGPGLSR